MNEKAKIISIYVFVVLISVGVIATSMWIRRERQERFAHQPAEPFADVGKKEEQVLLTLERDLVATNQDGREVRLSDLRDKVWVATQFFASCPMCFVTNSEDLRKLHAEFGDHPDFHIVSITVNPEQDDVEALKSYADKIGVKSSNWWLLTGPKKALYDYMQDEMKFLSVIENKDAAAEVRFTHDLGMEIYGRGMRLVKKRDLYYARTQNETLHEAWFNEVRNSIRNSLAAKSTEVAGR